MQTTITTIENDDDLREAQGLIAWLMSSEDSADQARLRAVLLDTNILLRGAVANDPLRQTALSTLHVLDQARTVVYICPQNMQEFRQVATRPAATNGLGWTSSDTANAKSAFEQRYTLVPETSLIYPAWRQIVEGSLAIGRTNFDARLVAVASTNSIAAILSFEARSFAKYLPFAANVRLIDPSE
jgi:predicted nucleic acid-binding protein